MPSRRCESCTPHPVKSTGFGYVWLHSASCTLYPRKKVGDERRPIPRDEQESRMEHPSGTIPVHKTKGYLEFWSDAEDDERVPKGEPK